MQCEYIFHCPEPATFWMKYDLVLNKNAEVVKGAAYVTVEKLFCGMHLEMLKGNPYAKNPVVEVISRCTKS